MSEVGKNESEVVNQNQTPAVDAPVKAVIIVDAPHTAHEISVFEEIKKLLEEAGHEVSMVGTDVWVTLKSEV